MIGLHHYVLFLVLIARKIGKYGSVESYSRSPQLPVPVSPKCLYFTGAGIFFFWQCGAAKYLRETCVLQKNMPIVGASAGSLTGLLLLAGVDFDEATEVALTQSTQSGVYNKPTGLAGELGPLLQVWLQTVIPDAVQMDTLSNLNVAVTPASVVQGGVKAPKLVSNFTSKADVLSAVMASCHVPVFLDGRPTAEYRGESVVDGSFWYFVTKNRNNGLPLPLDTAPDEVLWVDYTDDEDFMNSIEGTNFLSIVTEQGVREMVEAGYNHMKREHFYGRLPMARIQRPTFVLSTALRRAREMTPNLNVNVTVPSLNFDRAQAFAADSLKWLIAAASVDGIASIANLFIFSLASSVLFSHG